jgi:hypothetical protein
VEVPKLDITVFIIWGHRVRTGDERLGGAEPPGVGAPVTFATMAIAAIYLLLRVRANG